ncbi:MAG TPA: hypothetical protein DIT07_05405 [Sphingobacteriaceae bacterium]|nr:hypothetical protein [Sphingobacteriaceae bacterium]
MENLPKQSTYNYPEEEEFSFIKSYNKRKEDIIYLWKYRFKLIQIGILGLVLGAVTAWFWPVTYTARTTFVVEDAKASGGSLLSGLAGQLGLDIGSLNGGSSGILAGDNVLQLLKSESIIKKALLTPYPGKPDYSLADQYAESYKLKDKWKKFTSENKPVMFPVDTKSYSRLQDSLLQVIIAGINEDELSVNKPDKKLSFFELNATMQNEKLALLFSTRLMQQATDFYIYTKTKSQRTNVQRLQVRADSIGRLLNKKTYSASMANSILLDANPAYPTSNVALELEDRDKLYLSTIYAEILKNLEVSKTMLIQETPTFQVVDQPNYPLKKNKLKYPKTMILFSLALGSLFALFLLLKR